MGIRWRFQVDTLEVSGSFGSGPLSVIPFCHRISITHGATSTIPSTREVAYERQKIDNDALVAELVFYWDDNRLQGMCSYFGWSTGGVKRAQGRCSASPAPEHRITLEKPPTLRACHAASCRPLM